jgi:hypothetical protein
MIQWGGGGQVHYMTVRLRHLGQHFMKMGEFEDTHVSKVLRSVQSEGC